MTEFWDEPVYVDVDREAARDWSAERPPRIRAEDVLDGEELEDYYRHHERRY